MELWRHKILMFSLIFISLSLTVTHHFLRPAYKANASLLLQEASNSPLQAIFSNASGEGGAGRSFGYSSRNSEKLHSYITYLGSPEFIFHLQHYLMDHPDIERIKNAIPKLQQHPLDSDKVNDLFRKRMVQFSPGKAKTIVTHVITPDKKISVLLANLVSELALKKLKEQDSVQTQSAIDYIKAELQKVEREYKDISKRVVGLDKWSNLETRNEKISISSSQFLQKELVKYRSRIRANERKISKSHLMGSGAGDTQFVQLGALNKRLGRQMAAIRNQSLTELYQSMDLKVALLEEFTKTLFETKIQQISLNSRFRVLKRSNHLEVRRNISLIKKIFAALLLSFIIGLVFVFCWTTFHPTVTDKQILFSYGLKFLGSIPYFARKGARGTFVFMNRATIDTPKATAFRSVANKIQKAKDSSKTKDNSFVVGITSSVSKEGKTNISNNLAHCLGRKNSSVILVDCDIRKRDTSNFYNEGESDGLIQLIEYSSGLDKHIVKNVADRVDLLPAGRISSDLSDFLDASKFDNILDSLRKNYKYVILDTAPILAVHDAIDILSLTDMAVLISRVGYTRISELEETVSRLGDLDKDLFTILNFESTKGRSSSAYYYSMKNNKIPSNRVPELNGRAEI